MAALPVCRSCLRTILSQRQRTSHFASQMPSRLQRAIRQPTALRSTRAYATSRDDEEIGDKATTIAKERAERMRQADADFKEQYAAQGATETLFKECARQADYYIPEAFDRAQELPTNAAGEEIGKGSGWWYDQLGLTPTFNTWAQVTFLHMYLITVRLRYFPESYVKIWQQHFLDHFFYEAEHRMNIFHRIESKAKRQRYMKDVFDQWRGVLGAYDEGLVKGDAVLATAVWRNIFGGQADADWTKIAMIVSFMRRALRALDQAPDRKIVEAMVKFGTPESEIVLVDRPSAGMSAPFTAEDDAVFESFKQTGKLADE